MPLPPILLGVVLGLLYGSVFHLVRGGSFRKLLVFLVLAQLGFWGGLWLGQYMKWSLWPVGVLDAGTGTLGSVALLALSELLSRIKLPEPETTSQND